MKNTYANPQLQTQKGNRSEGNSLRIKRRSALEGLETDCTAWGNRGKPRWFSVAFRCVWLTNRNTLSLTRDPAGSNPHYFLLFGKSFTQQPRPINIYKYVIELVSEKSRSHQHLKTNLSNTAWAFPRDQERWRFRRFNPLTTNLVYIILLLAIFQSKPGASTHWLMHFLPSRQLLLFTHFSKIW